MKSIIKIVVALLVVSVCFNAGRAILGNSQFEDAVQQALLFDAAHASDPELIEMVKKTADQFGVPLDPNDINIRHVSSDLIIEMPYTDNVVLVPGVFARDWTFKPTATARILVGSLKR
ncbi:MAG: hypothetical protein ABI983_01755 [Acidobacteriota bacterium]